MAVRGGEMTRACRIKNRTAKTPRRQGRQDQRREKTASAPRLCTGHERFPFFFSDFVFLDVLGVLAVRSGRNVLWPIAAAPAGGYDRRRSHAPEAITP